MKLVIEGNETKIKRLAKELNLRCKRNNLVLTTESKKQPKEIEVVEPNEVKANPKKGKGSNSKK